MGKIHLLSDTLISQIAAGEVVERPASVVKELLENSLDAGANKISIEVEQGGMRFIAVRDNGCGMEREDARLAFTRHATSKISHVDDLRHIRSFGFRGEALSAIASIALVRMKTRSGTSDAGTEIIYEGGKMISEGHVGFSPGTEIMVRNLFFNTPARRKFLKTETTEFSHILSAVSHMALSHPGITFELKHNGKTLLQVPPQMPEERIQTLLGNNFLEESLPVSFQTSSIHIYGFIGKPGMNLSSKRRQYLFINGRDINDTLVSRAACDAYGSRLPGRVYPIFVLHIDMNPAEVDVNVHPRKLSVKFLDSQRIYRDIIQAVSQALEDNGQVGTNRKDERAFPKERGTFFQAAMEFTKQFMESTKSSEGLLQNEIHILSQIADSYILLQETRGLAIIDQHAAHERILYEEFRNYAAQREQGCQPLLVPLTVECSREEGLFLREALPDLEHMGFEFDEWSGNTFIIRSCPANLKTENFQKIFLDFLNDMAEERKKEKILPEKILKSMACKAAVKFGMPLSHQEQEQLLRRLEKTANNTTCPHGRPTRLTVTFEELERRFYRKK